MNKADTDAVAKEFQKAGLTPEAVDKIAREILEFMGRSTRAVDRSKQRMPVVTKIAQSLQKILMGDMSPLAEQKTRNIFKNKLKKLLLENTDLRRKK